MPLLTIARHAEAICEGGRPAPRMSYLGFIVISLVRWHYQIGTTGVKLADQGQLSKCFKQVEYAARRQQDMPFSILHRSSSQYVLAFIDAIQRLFTTH